MYIHIYIHKIAVAVNSGARRCITFFCNRYFPPFFSSNSMKIAVRGISLISEAVDMRACLMLYLFIYLLVQQRKVLTQLRWTVGL
jgi:hypothetical protein